MTTLATYWSMTINNPTETDMVLVRNPNDRYIRQLVWTPEVGEDGTSHVQAWIRLQRNQSMAHVKKLYPRAHLKPITKDDYNENSQQYAQKEDDTTAGHHTISLNDPLPGVDTILYRVLEQMYDRTSSSNKAGVIPVNDMLKESQIIEDEMVSERAGLEKLFISGTYDKMKRRFYKQIISRLLSKRQNDCVQEEVQQVEVPVYEEADEDGDGSESDQDSEGGGSESGEGEGTDEDSGSATDYSPD